MWEELKMPEQQFKRNTAYKLRIGDILIGKPILNDERFSFLEYIVDKYESSGETSYISFTVDDGSGQIRLKSFGDDTEKFKDLVQGQTVVIIGLLRYWNNELYIAPEIIREMPPKYLLIRKLETEKDKATNTQPVEKEKIIAIKDKILEIIKNSENNGGIETEQIISGLRDFSPGIINTEIQKLLEEGIIFEPRPGKMRYLG
jgi:hypothetical protein